MIELLGSVSTNGEYGGSDFLGLRWSQHIAELPLKGISAHRGCQHTESRPAWQKFLSWGAPGSKSMARADVSGTEYETGLHFLHTWVFKILDSPCYDTQQQPLFNWGKWRRGCSGRKKPNCGMNVRIKRLSLRGLLPSPLYVFLYPIPTLLSLVPVHSFLLFWLHEPTSFLLFAVIQLDLYFLLLWYQPQHAV